MCCAVCAVCFLSQFAECRVLKFAVRVPRLFRLHAHCDFFVLYVRFVGCAVFLLRAVCTPSVWRVSHVRKHSYCLVFFCVQSVCRGLCADCMHAVRHFCTVRVPFVACRVPFDNRTVLCSVCRRVHIVSCSASLPCDLRRPCAVDVLCCVCGVFFVPIC